MPNEEKKDTSIVNQTTQLRVVIEEDAYGNLDVQHECVLKGTTTAVPMRPSHIAGQLTAAAHVILSKTYKKVTLSSEEKEKVSVPEKKK